MNILHVIPAVAPRYGGPSAVLPQMCCALERAGVSTTVVATDADGNSRVPVPIGVETTYQGVRAFFFPRQHSESFKYSKPLATWLAGNVERFDVVHIHAVLSHACLAAGRASRAARVPYVVRPLGTLDSWSLAQKALKKRALLWAGGRRLLGNAAAIHYTSREEQRDVEASLGLANGVVIPLGIDDEWLSANGRPSEEEPCRPGLQPRQPPYVLALSRLHPVKGLDRLIAAFARASRCAPDWRLVIAGAGDEPYARELQQRAQESGIGSRVQFPGWVAGDDKRALILGASLFAVPSLHESFGVSLVEALACGVPAVVSTSVHLADDIRDADAGWVSASEPDAFARTLMNAMTSADERARRGEAAALLARRFAWSNVGTALLALYRQITSDKAVSREPASPQPGKAISPEP